MRINKKIVNKHEGRNKWFGKDYYDQEYFINVKVVFADIFFTGLAIIMVGLFLALVVGLYSWGTPSKYETSLYNKRCDIVSANKPHYLTRSNRVGSNNYVCAIAPDWHQVDL